MFEFIKKTLGETGTQILFFIVAFAIFYFFFIRPKQQEEATKDDFMKSLKKGSKVVTIGGIHGTIADFIEERIILTTDRKGSQITIAKEAVSVMASQKMVEQKPKK
ncbi:MAG: preprotein translocase subunit YajC [Bacteroidota bacterium]